MNDQIAVSRLKQGDLNGLEALVRRYQVQAVHAAHTIVAERAMAEDVVQAAFVKVAERIHQFDDGRPFAPWFFRIVVNDAVKLAKKQKRQISLDEPQDQPTSQLARWLVDPGLAPDEVLEKKEIGQKLLKAIASLPPGQRAVIVMRYYLEMTMSDMSRRTGRPLSTIKWWLRDARRRLRGSIDEPVVDRDES